MTPEAARILRESERAALACTRGVVVTSPATARTLAREFDVPAERITVAEPGTDRVALVPRQQTDAVALLAVGAIVPRKGYDVLIEALSGLIDLPWRLTVVGDCRRDLPLSSSTVRPKYFATAPATCR